MNMEENHIEDTDYPIGIRCVCGKSYDGPRWRLLECPFCGHVWDLYPGCPHGPPPKFAKKGVPATIKVAQLKQEEPVSEPVKVPPPKTITIEYEHFRTLQHAKMFMQMFGAFFERLPMAKALWEDYQQQQRDTSVPLEEVYKELNEHDEMETHRIWDRYGAEKLDKIRKIIETEAPQLLPQVDAVMSPKLDR